VIDIPGLDDCDGNDEEILRKMVDDIKRITPKMHAFILLFNGTENFAGSI